MSVQLLDVLGAFFLTLFIIFYLFVLLYIATQESKAASPTALFLKYLELPNDDTADIDLKQMAVIVLCHLDRLATPFYPTSEKKAMVHAFVLWGLLWAK